MANRKPAFLEDEYGNIELVDLTARFHCPVCRNGVPETYPALCSNCWFTFSLEMAQASGRKLWEQSALTCHNHLTCAYPDHMETLTARFMRRLISAQIGTNFPQDLMDQIKTTMQQVAFKFGLRHERIEIDEPEIPQFGTRTIHLLGIPAERVSMTAGTRMWHEQPFNHDDLVRRVMLREKKICPFGLNCTEPIIAVDMLWSVFSILAYEIEPWIEGNLDEWGLISGWAWDSQLYQSLWNHFEVLDLVTHANWIKRFVDKKKREARQ